MAKVKYQSEFLRIMEERGFIHQCTNESALDKRLTVGGVSAYIGFDCTASSLHVGSLIQIMALRWLQKTGNKPVVLLGGGTTKIGDPSGKDEARKVLSAEEIAANMQSIRANFEQFLSFGDKSTDAQLVDNAQWLDGLNYIDFLRDYGRHFSVNRMLSMDSVKLRLGREQNLSFLEFNYMILQAYDFVELQNRFGVRLQIGGSDQWGNIVSGIDLFRRVHGGKQFKPLDLATLKDTARVVEVQPMIQSRHRDPENYTAQSFLKELNQDDDSELFGLTTPLLATSSGVKMGKTASGAVWLHKDMLSPYDYWQFWRNSEDADVGRFLRLFTELPIDEIKKLEKLQGSEINEAKKKLADEATKLCHGDKVAKQAAETARKTFEEGATGDALPEIHITAAELGKGMPAYELLRLSGLASSGGDARRLIRGGGARIADRKVTDENELIGPGQFAEKSMLKLSVGKKKHAVVKLN